MPRSLKKRSKVPSLLPTSTTRSPGARAARAIDRVGHAAEMLGQAERDRGRVGEIVVLHLGIDDVEQLQVPAVAAKIEVERRQRGRQLRLSRHGRGPDIGRRHRNRCERNHHLDGAGMTEAAVGAPVEQGLHCGVFFHIGDGKVNVGRSSLRRRFAPGFGVRVSSSRARMGAALSISGPTSFAAAAWLQARLRATCRVMPNCLREAVQQWFDRGPPC